MFETAAAYKDVADLIGRRDAALRKQRDLERELLLPDRDPVFGPWPGAAEPLGLAPRSIYQMQRVGFFGGEEARVLGTWRAKPILDDDRGDG